jgi:hypothetical protein
MMWAIPRALGALLRPRLSTVILGDSRHRRSQHQASKLRHRGHPGNARHADVVSGKFDQSESRPVDQLGRGFGLRIGRRDGRRSCELRLGIA